MSVEFCVVLVKVLLIVIVCGGLWKYWESFERLGFIEIEFFDVWVL